MNRECRRRRLIVPLLLAALSAGAPLRGQSRRPLSSDEITDLSIRALQGESSAKRKLVKEYRERLAADPAGRTDPELMEKLAETLEIVAPRALKRAHPAGRENPSKREKIVVGKPSTLDFIALSSSAARGPEPSLKYFVFVPGEIRTYAGERRDPVTARWRPSDRALRIHVLDARPLKNGGLEARTLRETFSRRGAWLAEQSFDTYRITNEGVELRRKMAFSQPEPGKALALGALPPRLLARFPLQEGALTADGFRLQSLSGSVSASSAAYPDCLVVAGQVDGFSFSPDTGLVRLEAFDERWTLADRAIPPAAEPAALSERDRVLLKEGMRKFCGDNRLALERILDLRQTGGSNGVKARILVFRKDEDDPEQRRYRILDLDWTKWEDGASTLWQPQTPFTP